MQSKGKFMRDPIPNIKNAGVSTNRTAESAAACLQPNLQDPPTPPHLKKYRKSYQNQPGIKQVHPGLFDDVSRVDQNQRFGQKTTSGEHVDHVIKAQNLQGLAARFNDIKESKYASMIKEPLAKGYERGYQWPEQIVQNKENYSFGVQTINSENAKAVLYPQRNNWMQEPDEKELEVQKLYKKTHGNFAPGEQREREYQWPFDKTKQRFGYGEQRQLNGAANSIHHERNEQCFPKTIIVKKTVEDMRAVAQDQLGQPKNLGQGKPPVPEDFRFGIRNITSPDTWNAAKCLHGEPREIELEPDRDLGRCVKPGSRNVPRRPEDQNRIFGCPTIRTDIPFKEKRSVADYNNYGDEPEAVDLLFPSTFTEIGITEYDFQMPRPKEEIRILFERIGYKYKIGKFNAMYNRAKELMPQYSDNVSVRAFMMAVNEMHHEE